MSVDTEILPVSHVEELVRAMVRALRAFQMYLPNNPMYQRGAQSLADAFLPVWAVIDEVSFTVTETEMTWEGEVVYSQPSKAESFAFWLYKDGMRLLTLRKGCEEDEIIRLLQTISRARQLPADASDDLLTLLWDQDFSRIHYRFAEVIAEPVVYDPQAVAMSGQEATPEATRERVREDAASSRQEGVVDLDRTGHMIQVRTTFRRAFAELRRKFGVEPGCGAIDYAQLLGGNRPKGATREEEVASISRFCQQLPGEFNCPIMLLSQLNRAVENRPDKRPNMADLRESGSLEQDAAGIFLFYRDEYYHPETEAKGVAEVIVGKFRNGATGTIEACYEGPTMRYYSPSDGIREACDEFDDGIGAINL